MSRSSKGPRLHLRHGRIDRRTKRPIPDRYYIRDGSFERSTGFGPDRLADAERELAAYIQSKFAKPAPNSDPSQVLVAEALSLYAVERGPQLRSDPATMRGFTKALLAWWADRTVGDVRRSSCQAYVAHRTAQPIRHGRTGRMVSAETARRELELLSAAISHWDNEHRLLRRPTVWLPEKRESNRDALTRGQVARLLMAARGYRLENERWQRLQPSTRANRAHLRRFILLSLYTGSRSKVTKRLRWQESTIDPWVDLAHATIYRRGRDETVARNKRRPHVKLPRKLLAHMKRWARQDSMRGVGLVIHHGGREISSTRTGFASCVADAGLPTEITPHWLRHTAATWLMEKAVSPWEAAGYLGMSYATLEKHYGHHRPDSQSAARKAMG